jgi:hypothetical protein
LIDPKEQQTKEYDLVIDDLGDDLPTGAMFHPTS